MSVINSNIEANSGGDLPRLDRISCDAPPRAGGDHLRFNLKLATLDGVTAYPLYIFSQPSSFAVLALLTTVFSLTPIHLSILMSLPAWMNFFQVLLLPMIARRVRAQTLAYTAIFLQVVSWSVLMFSLRPILRESESFATVIFFLTFLAANLAYACNQVGWYSWIQEWIPPRIRGRYLGVRFAYSQILWLFFSAFGGLVIDRAKGSLLAYEMLFAGAVFLGCISACIEWRMRTDSISAAAAAPPVNVRAEIDLVRRSSPLLRFIAFNSIFGFVMGGIPAFYFVFLYRYMGVSTGMAGRLNFMGAMAAIVTSKGWGLLLDRHGNKPVILLGVTGTLVLSLFWCALTPNTVWIVYFLYTLYIAFSMAYQIGQNNFVLKLSPPGAKAMAFSANLASTSLFTALGGIAGGWIVELALAFGARPATTYRWLFAIPTIFGAFSCAMLVNVEESGASTVRELIAALSHWRTIASIFSLDLIEKKISALRSRGAKRKESAC